ncbi:MAG TPA: peptide ABC transporter substrate-binding protein [Chloroflexi bacterium]|jgi:oligopeptide transport system substrate-binding protein|nr:peptide ABC transporter substrate-binding protein [Chloroflexota bacterium]
MFRSRHLVLMALLVIASMIPIGCAWGQASDKQINMNLGIDPPTVDPGLAMDTTSEQVVSLLFLGLTDFDEETLEVIPELATEWFVSDDGLVWTFKMRNDVEWVRYDPAAGKAEKMGKVTAHDVMYGVKRTIDPATASDYAYVNYIIKNAEAVNTGESDDLDSVGVRALDDFTVEFTLEQPAGYFPGIAGIWVNYPLPKQVIDEHGANWTTPGVLWSSGPYMLETWEHDNRMAMVKNPHYYDADKVDIDRINFAMIADDATAFAMYKNGELDVQNAPLDELDRIKADPQLSQELHIAPMLCTYYYGYNVTKSPFDNPLVRQAFSYAVDRQGLIDTMLMGGQLAAKSVVPPGILGSVAEDETFEGVRYDPVKAAELLAEAGYPNGEGLPAITLMFNTSEGHEKIARFMQQSWKDTLGVEVGLANQDWNEYLDTLNHDSPQIWRYGWCADYPDPNNWLLEPFHPTKGINSPGWDASLPGAQHFMRLVEQAAASSDSAERQALYREAEQVLVVDEAIVIPIYYYTRVVLTKPYIKRTDSVIGGEKIHKWEIDPSRR